jgi:gluconate 5-dehydrogenase
VNRPTAQVLLDDLFSLKGKTVVVTGACGFFGRHFTHGLLQAGGRVIMLSHSPAVREHERAHAAEFGDANVAAVEVDLYDREALERAVGELVAKHDVDVLVNNAYDFSPRTGFNTPDGNLEAASFEQWATAFESGIYWAARLTQLVGTQMCRRGGGNVINVSSMYGLVSPDLRLYEGTRFFNPPSYGVMKAGLLAFTRYVAAAWGRFGIRCNALVPGAFSNTEDAAYNAVSRDDPFLRRLEARTLLNRVGKPRELLGALILLASDASAYMTGQAIVVDGGWTVT